MRLPSRRAIQSAAPPSSALAPASRRCATAAALRRAPAAPIPAVRGGRSPCRRTGRCGGGLVVLLGASCGRQRRAGAQRRTGCPALVLN
jgi:hypothetical protein